MADEGVVVKFGANVEGLRAGAREATAHVESLRGTLLDMKAEATQTGRAAKFFANDIASLIPVADGAKGAIRDLLEVFLAGTAFGAAAAAVKLIVAVFEELHKEGTTTTVAMSKAADDWLAHIKAVHDETQKLRLALRGVSTTELQAYTELQPLREQRATQQAALSKAEGELAEAEIKGAQAAGVLSGKRGATMAAYTKQAHDAIAAAREDLRITKEKIETLEKEFALRSRIAAAAPLEKEIEEAKTRAAQATEDSAVNLARIQTEQEDRDAREMGKLRLNADEKMLLAKEVADAQRRADQATEESAINLGRIETEQRRLTKDQLKDLKLQIHEMGAVAKEVGLVVGEAFAGMASGSISAGKAIIDILKAIVKALIDAAIKMVLAHAAAAAAGAAESQASIPGIGPFLAIAALAAVEGAVLALLSIIPSASGGFDIPHGVNPITQLHGGEMVLPAELADKVRSGAGGDGDAGDLHVHLHGTLIDGAGVEKFFRSNEARRAVSQMRRLGEWPG